MSHEVKSPLRNGRKQASSTTACKRYRRLLIQFSIPILTGSLFQQAYTLADRIIVGRFVGDTAFSAISATNALSMMFMSMCMGAAIGTGVVVSQFFGAKDEEGTAASIANGGYTCLLIALVMTVIALLTTKPVLLLLNTPESILPNALTYMYIFTGGLLAVAAYPIDKGGDYYV